MGREAQVEAFWPDGREDRGRLQFEPPKLIFRGAERRVFEGTVLGGAVAEDRDLVLPGAARFRLPISASRWAEAIASPKGRLEKLGVKPGLRIAVVNLDDAAFLAELAARSDLHDLEAGALDLVFYGADNAAELAAASKLIAAVAPRGALWIVSLKGTAARVRDVEVIGAGRALGLVDTKVVAFSESRTALRFVRRK